MVRYRNLELNIQYLEEPLSILKEGATITQTVFSPLHTTIATIKRIDQIAEYKDKKQDAIVNDLLDKRESSHQIYELLDILSKKLGTSTPIATLETLIAAYHADNAR